MPTWTDEDFDIIERSLYNEIKTISVSRKLYLTLTYNVIETTRDGVVEYHQEYGTLDAAVDAFRKMCIH